jgi:Zn-finger nucleic acid-binding protein
MFNYGHNFVHIACDQCHAVLCDYSEAHKVMHPVEYPDEDTAARKARGRGWYVIYDLERANAAAANHSLPTWPEQVCHCPRCRQVGLYIALVPCVDSKGAAILDDQDRPVMRWEWLPCRQQPCEPPDPRRYSEIPF